MLFQKFLFVYRELSISCILQYSYSDLNNYTTVSYKIFFSISSSCGPLSCLQYLLESLLTAEVMMFNFLNIPVMTLFILMLDEYSRFLSRYKDAPGNSYIQLITRRSLATFSCYVFNTWHPFIILIIIQKAIFWHLGPR